MALYATALELASYLQRDLDTASATLALTLASGEFSREACTAFTATSETWSALAAGVTEIELPFNKVTAVTAVRVNGVVVTGWTLRGGRLYRSAGFGYRYGWPPDEVEVDVTHGYTTVPDDVKLAVLEIAAGLYENPIAAVSESIDDHTVRYDPNSRMTAGRPWRDVAADYRGLLVA
jgi:hypothetical protein